jgi:hypothetical protein
MSKAVDYIVVTVIGANAVFDSWLFTNNKKAEAKFLHLLRDQNLDEDEQADALDNGQFDLVDGDCVCISHPNVEI